MLFFYVTLIDNDTDRDIFEQIYNDYKKRMLFVANKVLHDQYESEDAVHNALIGIAKNISTITNLEPEKVGAYVLTAAYNAALNLSNRKAKINIDSFSETLTDISDGDFFEKLHIRERYDEVIAAIKLLKPIYRDVLYMHYVLDQSAKKIGRLLNRKTATVEKQITRGKQILLNTLESSESKRSDRNDYKR